VIAVRQIVAAFAKVVADHGEAMWSGGFGLCPDEVYGKAAMAKVRAWISIHRDDLFANWELLITEGKFFKIDPLR